MKQVSFLAIMGISFILGCTTEVNLTATNPTTFPQTVRVEATKANGTKTLDLPLGKVEPNQVIKTKFDVKHGGQFTVVNSFLDGVDAGEFKRGVTSSDPDPLQVDVRLTLGSGRLVDDAAGTQKIMSVLRNFGPNIGYKPIDVDVALKTIFGALIVLTPPKPGELGDAVEHFRITPGRFAPITTHDEFRYPSAHSDETSEVTGSGSASVAVSVPIYGSLGIDTSSDNAYQIKYSLNGFGMVEKVLPKNWSYAEALNKLSAGDKKALYSAVRKNKDSIILFVNKMYVVESGTFSLLKSKKLAVGAKLDGASVVTSKGSYKYEESWSNAGSYANKVINIAGIKIDLDVASSDHANVINFIPLESASNLLLNSLETGDSKFTVRNQTEHVPLRLE